MIQIKFGEKKKQNKHSSSEAATHHPKFSNHLSLKIIKSLKYKEGISQENVKYVWQN